MKKLAKSLLTLAAFALAGVACAQDKTDDTKPAASGSGKVTDIKIAIKTSKGMIEGTIFASKVPLNRGQFSQSRQASLLRRHRLPPRHSGLHDPRR